MLKKVFSCLFVSCFLLCKVLGATSSPLLTREGKPVQPLLDIARIYQISEEDQFDSILAFTQAQFLQQSKARWVFPVVVSDKTDELYAAFDNLGCVGEIHPKQKYYTYALVLGSTETNMKERISFLKEQWKNGVRFSHVVLLSGERPLSPEIEPLSASFTTESDLIPYLWDTLTEGELHDLPITLVRSKMKDSSTSSKRPNTMDTVIDWLKTSPSEGSCLAVSSQPFVAYQQSVLQTYLPSRFTVDTIGPKRTQGFFLSLYLDTLAKWMFQESIRLSQE